MELGLHKCKVCKKEFNMVDANRHTCVDCRLSSLNSDPTQKYPMNVFAMITGEDLKQPLNEEATKVLLGMIGELKDQQRLAIECSYRDCLTPREMIASGHFDCDMMRVGRIKARAFFHLRRRKRVKLILDTNAGIACKKPLSKDDCTKDTLIYDLDLSSRAYRILMYAGIKTVGDLTALTPENLLEMRGLGETSVEEIWNKLLEVGMGLSE